MIAAGNIAHQESKALIQPFQHLVRREQGKSRRREFDGERHAVESLANIDDRRRVRGGELEIGLCVPDTCEQQRYGGSRGHLDEIGLAGWPPDRGQAERRHAQQAFADELQLLLGRREHFQVVGGPQQFDDQSAEIRG